MSPQPSTSDGCVEPQGASARESHGRTGSGSSVRWSTTEVWALIRITESS
jgi:hypothetical protein